MSPGGRRQELPDAAPSAAAAESPSPLFTAALWSGSSTRQQRTSMPTWLFIFLLAACLVLDGLEEEGDGILSSHNGLFMKFVKSLHAINHYFFATSYTSRSLLGCFVLKFAGSSLVSLSLGRVPSWTEKPGHCISFLIAFSLVRSDSLEATELSAHMRYAAHASIALNLLSALYKMRALSHLVDESHLLGRGPTLHVGTLAFSTCKALMAMEFWCLRRWRVSRLRAAPTAAPTPTIAAPIAKEPVSSSTKLAMTPVAPDMRVTVGRHFAYLSLLMLGRESGSRIAYSLCKIVVLGVLFAMYNNGLLRHDKVYGGSAPPEPTSPRRLILSTLRIPEAAKRQSTPRASSAHTESWIGLALLWVLGSVSIRLSPPATQVTGALSPASSVAVGVSLLAAERSTGKLGSHGSPSAAPTAWGVGVGLHHRNKVQ